MRKIRLGGRTRQPGSSTCCSCRRRHRRRRFARDARRFLSVYVGARSECANLPAPRTIHPLVHSRRPVTAETDRQTDRQTDRSMPTHRQRRSVRRCAASDAPARSSRRRGASVFEQPARPSPVHTSPPAAAAAAVSHGKREWTHKADNRFPLCPFCSHATECSARSHVRAT